MLTTCQGGKASGEPQIIITLSARANGIPSGPVGAWPLDFALYLLPRMWGKEMITALHESRQVGFKLILRNIPRNYWFKNAPFLPIKAISSIQLQSQDGFLEVAGGIHLLLQQVGTTVLNWGVWFVSSTLFFLTHRGLLLSPVTEE